MTASQDVPAPSPTVSDAMREAVARITRSWTLSASAQADAICNLFASALAALERENTTLRAERDEERGLAEDWKATLDTEMEIQAEVRAELATYRASAERMEAALCSQEQEVTLAVSQLRHAYVQLHAERVRKQREFADGLIAPQIRRLEIFTPKEKPETGEAGR